MAELQHDPGRGRGHERSFVPGSLQAIQAAEPERHGGRFSQAYHLAMVDGAEQAREKAEETEEIHWDDIMDEIRKVKGIGRELSERINAAVTGRFDNDTE